LRNYQTIAAVFLGLLHSFADRAEQWDQWHMRCIPSFRSPLSNSEFFAGVMGDVPVEFTINNLNSPAGPIVNHSRREADASFAEAMRMAAKIHPVGKHLAPSQSFP
jgi:hypothetical protein